MLADCYLQIQSHLEQFEEWRREDSAQIQQLTEQIKKLRTQPSPPPFLSADDIRSNVRQIIVEQLLHEVTPILDQFRSACLQNKDQILGELDKQLQPTLVLTNDICYRAHQQITSRTD